MNMQASKQKLKFKKNVDIDKDKIVLNKNKYFHGGNWGQCLELLRHLCRYSENVILVSGDDGTGKTSLKKELKDSNTSEDFIYCEIQGSPTLEVATFMEQIAAGFGLPWDEEEENFDDNSSMGNENETWVVLIDDAHMLTLPVISAIIQLANATQDGASLHIVLFAKPSLEQEVKQSYLSESFDQNVHIIELEEMSLPEMEAFLLYQWRQAGNNSKLPFDKSTIKRMHSLSSGNIKEVIQLAQNRMTNVNVSSSNKSKKRHFSLKLVALTIAVGAMFAAFLHFFPQIEEVDSNDDTPSANAQDRLNAKLEEVRTKNKSSVSKNNIKATDNKKIASNAKKEHDLQKQLELSQLKVKKLDKARLDMQKLLADYKQKILKLESESKVKDEAILKLKSQLKDNIKVINKMDKNNTRAISKKHNQKITQAKPSSGESLLALSPKLYTLQILGTKDVDKIQSFIKENKLEHNAYYYETKYNENPWYILVYGTYQSRKEAYDAISNLKSSLRKMNPWPREVSGIQTSIRKNNERSK